MDCTHPVATKESVDPDFLLRTALDVAVHTLRAGGEVHRVEETVERICYAHGAAHVEVFSINSIVTATVRMECGTYASHTRRVLSIESHMARLSRLNEISRALCRREMTLEAAQVAVAEAKHYSPFPSWLELIGSLICAGGFAIFFGGSARDMLASGLISLLITGVIRLIPSSFNAFASLVLLIFLGGLLATFACRLQLADGVDYIVIGLIMPHIPGLTFGAALRDLLLGDILTGLIGLMRTLLLAVSIAFGIFLAFALTGGVV